MTDEEIAEACDALEELCEEVREDLAAGLGGDPENYNADHVNEVCPDGGHD